MAANLPISGASIGVQYGWETTFGTASAAFNKAFSQGVKLTTYDLDNDAEFIYALGSQDAMKSVVKEFKGSYGLEFILSDPWWFRAILGGVPTSATTTSTSHTWTVANSGITNTLPSFTTQVNMDYATTDSQHDLLGCTASTMTLTAAVGETIKCKLDGAFVSLAKSTTIVAAASWTAAVEEPFSFAQASVDFPSGTTIPDIQNFEITWNRNTEYIYALGSRLAQKNVAKQREWNIKLTAIYEADPALFDTFLGSATVPTTTVAEVATCVLTITNGLATTATRSYTFTFANCLVKKISAPMSIEDVPKLDLEIQARNLTSLIVVNNTATAL